MIDNNIGIALIRKSFPGLMGGTGFFTYQRTRHHLDSTFRGRSLSPVT